MPVEVAGQQLRIRIKSPKQFTKFRIQDVGRRGRLQRVAAWSLTTGWQTVGWRLNLSTYSTKAEAESDLEKLRIDPTLKDQALRKLDRWWTKVPAKRSTQSSPSKRRILTNPTAP